MLDVLASDVVTPIDRYLAEQQSATAVETFSRRHDADLLAPQERWYTDRLPTSAPADGQQYAFRIDLDRCTGCKACVAACHSLNGLDDGESWRSVGLLVGAGAEAPRQQTVPSGCHHCVDPACLAGCPTNAYEKDPFTGIVRHLDDQCIGCSYCELTCPYEVPQLNRRLGIVRKCDLCADRLADGEAPACVQGCPTSAITITVVDTASVRARAEGTTLVPGAPSSDVTAPTTQYVGRVLTEDVVAADHHAIHLSRSHPPLVVMLVLTQLSVGALVATFLSDLFRAEALPTGAAVTAALAGVVALAASVLHLGRPTMAWRAVLGLRHSWLSREIVAFGVYAGLAVAYAAATVLEAPVVQRMTIGAAATIAGLVGVGCSALIYVVTHRTWWAARHTVPKFVATASALGTLQLAAVLLASGVVDVAPLLAVTVVSTGISLGGAALDAAPVGGDDDLFRTSILLRGPLAAATRTRVFCSVVGGVLGPIGLLAIVSADPDSTAGAATLAFLCTLVALVGALAERFTFFVASATPRMPGGFRS